MMVSLYHPPLNDGRRDRRRQETVRWHAYIGGNPRGDQRGTISLVLLDGKQPNRLHRWMQYLVLGIYWRKEGGR